MGKRKLFFIAIMVLCVSILFVFQYVGTKNTKQQKKSKSIPSFCYKTLNNTKFCDTDFDTTKYPVIIFFNSDCSHCSTEINEIITNITKLEDCRLLLVSWEDSVTVKAFYDRFSLGKYDKMIKVAFAEETQIKKDFKVYVIPTTYIYNREKAFIKYKPGPYTIDELLKYLI